MSCPAWKQNYFLLLNVDWEYYFYSSIWGHFAPVTYSYIYALFASSNKVTVSVSLSLLLYHQGLINIISTVVYQVWKKKKKLLPLTTHATVQRLADLVGRIRAIEIYLVIRNHPLDVEWVWVKPQWFCSHIQLLQHVSTSRPLYVLFWR